MATRAYKKRERKKQGRLAKLRGKGDRYTLTFECYDERTRAEWRLVFALAKLLAKKRQLNIPFAEDVLRNVFFQRRRVLCRTLNKMGVDYHEELGLPKLEKGGRGHTLALAYKDPKGFLGRAIAKQEERPSMVTRYSAGE